MLSNSRLFILLLLFTAPCAFAKQGFTVSSPDKKIQFVLGSDASGLIYQVRYKGELLVDRSRLSISFKEGGLFGRRISLSKPVFKQVEEEYSLIAGKASKVHSLSNEAKITATEQTGMKRQLTVEVRAFNDGVAFRYVIPGGKQWQNIEVTDEANTFNLTQNPVALTLFRANYTTSHEGNYDKLHISEIKPDTLMDLPALFQFPKGVYVAITEANLLDYAGMYLIKHNGVLKSTLSPLPNQTEIKVRAKLPHNSPWRVMMISDRAGAFIESNILTNLSEPCRIKDTSWIKAGKTTFPWWNGNVLPDTTFAPGNNYETNMYYVHFCAQNNFLYHSVVEYGQHEWYVNDGADFAPGPHADPSTAVPGLDMKQLCDSAAKVGVGIRVWVHFYALYPKLDTTFAQYERWGVKGLMCDFMDRDDQQMVQMQEEVLQKAAQHHLHIQFHGAYKPTGTSRTYPNEFTREGTLNYENDKWGDRVQPDDDVNIAFTRLIAGSTDYHLGGFRAATPKTFKVRFRAPMVLGTRCHMLGMYVVLENAQGMACDYPDAYIGQPGFEFLKQVPVTWDETKVLNASVGDYVTVARRKGDDWYIGTINSNTPRSIKTALSFLPAGDYNGEVYSDALNDKDPNHLVKVICKVNNHSVINTDLAWGGGQVVRLVRVGK